MKICITLDDVIRAKTQQIGKIYKKHINPKINLEELDLSSEDFYKQFGFEDEKEYKEFLYVDYPFEIFGEASVVEKMLDKNLNLWHIKQDNNDDLDEKIELCLANPFEYNATIGFTYFFLSKIGTRVREVYLPFNALEIWDKCDVLITATPKLLKNKPEGKIVIKIETDYNKDIESDYTYKSLSDFINDENILKNIIEKRND